MPGAGPHDDRQPGALPHLVDLRRPPEVGHELRRAAGGEVGEGEPPVALGGLGPRRQGEGPEVTQTTGCAQIVVATLLARIAGHGLFETRELVADVDQQIGVGGLIDLVDEDLEPRRGLSQGGGRPVVRGTVVRGTILRGTILRGTVLRGTVLRNTVLPNRRQQTVQGVEGGPVVGAHLQRRGHQEEIRPLGQQRPAQAPLRRLQVAVQLAVRQPEVIGAGETQHLPGRRRLTMSASPGRTGWSTSSC